MNEEIINYKNTCKTTSLFREPNLYNTLKILTQNKQKDELLSILLIGASPEELVSIWAYSKRLRLDNLTIIGSNNADNEVQRFSRYVKEKKFLNLNTNKWIGIRGFTFNDLQLGIIESQVVDYYDDPVYKISDNN